MGRKVNNLVGKVFGRLTVVALTNLGSGGHKRWLCACTCGGERIVRGDVLLCSHCRSCGCLVAEAAVLAAPARTHGMSGTTEYRAWSNMICRCEYKNSSKFKYYGGRGITVCMRWRVGVRGKSGFECFYEDMGRRPSPKHSIDRYPDNDGNYTPGNCRWATQQQQLLNRRPYKRRALEELS